MKRKALITLILGTALAIAPAANAMALLPDGGGSGSTKAVFLHTDVLGGNGTVQPGVVTDGWMSSITPSLTLRPDILGGGGGLSTATPVTTGGSSIDWTTAIPATLLGVMLVAAAALAVTRRRSYRLSF